MKSNNNNNRNSVVDLLYNKLYNKSIKWSLISAVYKTKNPKRILILYVTIGRRHLITDDLEI